MDAEKFLKEHIRMCQWYEKQKDGCALCPRYKEACPEGWDFITFFSMVNIKEYISTIEQWSNDHPVKTIQQDFLEKYPNAMMCNDDSPKACCKHLGYIMSCPENKNCKECWNTPLEDDE